MKLDIRRKGLFYRSYGFVDIYERCLYEVTSERLNWYTNIANIVDTSNGQQVIKIYPEGRNYLVDILGLERFRIIIILKLFSREFVVEGKDLDIRLHQEGLLNFRYFIVRKDNGIVAQSNGFKELIIYDYNQLLTAIGIMTALLLRGEADAANSYIYVSPLYLL